MAVVDVDREEISLIDVQNITERERDFLKNKGPKNCTSLFRFFKWDFYYYVTHWDYIVDYDILFLRWSDASVDSCMRFDEIDEIVDYLYIITFISLGKIKEALHKLSSNNSININFSKDYILRYLARFYTPGQLELVKYIIARTKNYENMYDCLVASILYKNNEIRDVILSEKRIINTFNDDQMDAIKTMMKNI